MRPGGVRSCFLRGWLVYAKKTAMAVMTNIVSFQSSLVMTDFDHFAMEWVGFDKIGF